jgi:hypothetical protein
MPKWEYCEIHFFLSEDTEKETKFLRYLYPDRAEDKEIEMVGQTLAQLGAESWELVSHTQRMTLIQDEYGHGRVIPVGETLWLKRPLE